MAGIRLQVHNLIQILVIASRYALLQAGFFMSWYTASLPDVYHKIPAISCLARVFGDFYL